MDAVIRNHLTESAFPADVVDWLCDVWRVIQAFDDLADGMAVAPEAVYAAGYAALIKMPSNPFFMARSGALLPVMALQFLKWQASDQAERAGLADERSFVWRAGYYDLILAVALLCFAPEQVAKMPILQMYGETFAEYRTEFPHA